MSKVIEPGSVAVAEAPAAQSSPRLREHADRGARGIQAWNLGVLLVLGAAVAVLVGLAAIWQMPAYDLWWQLKTGELILQNHGIPHVDVFSFTAAGKPWVVQEWLTEVLFFLLYARVSPEALVFLKVGMIAIAFLLLLGRCWTRTRQPLVSVAVTVLAAYAARGFFDMRPQIFTYLFLAYFLLILDQWRLGRVSKAIWTLPGALLLWANCHSGFALGLVVLGVETVTAAVEAWVRRDTEDRRWRTLLNVLGASVVAGLLTPNGVQSYIYPLTLMTHQGMLDQVGEWLSPDFHQPWLRAYEVLLIAAITCWGVSSRPRRLADVVLVLGLVYASLYSTRHTPIFTLVCAPIVAEHVGSGLAGMQRFITHRLRFVEALPVRLLPAVALLVALLWGIGREWHRIPAGSRFSFCADVASLPHAALDYLKAHPGEGNLLNEYNWGGYCLYRLYPEQKIFIDGRAEVYFDKAFPDYSNIVNTREGWGTLLDDWHIDTILVPPMSSLARALPLIGGWHIAYQDATALILRRNPGAAA
jgi:hypothetical protein